MIQKKHRKNTLRFLLFIALLVVQRLPAEAQTQANNTEFSMNNIIMLGMIIGVIILAVILARQLVKVKVRKKMFTLSEE